MKTKPTKQELLSFFEYDTNRGFLVWKNHWEPSTRTKLIGKIAGSVDGKGYVQVMLKGEKFKVHRLIWFLENGTWPKEIDHKNGIKTDNRIDNLREATRRQNNQNRSTHRAGRLQGVYWHKGAKKWLAQIVVNGKNNYLGLHATEEEAHSMYKAALTVIGADHGG